MNTEVLRVDIAAHAHEFGANANTDTPPVGVTTCCVNTVWTYRANDPYGIDLMIFCGETVTTWSLARESVLEAISLVAHGVGLGDARLSNFAFPWGYLTVLTLQSPSGSVDLTFETRDLVTFLAATDAVVAVGEEAARMQECIEHELFGFEHELFGFQP